LSLGVFKPYAMLCYAMLCSDGELSVIISERRWGPRLPERPAHRKSSIGLATAELPKVEAYKPYAMLCYAMLCYAMLCYAMLCSDGWWQGALGALELPL